MGSEWIFGREFGDGSNRWIPGVVETVQNPVDAVTNPYDTVAGAADAAAINFDEGAGGLVSLVDDEPGNTAGPGDSNVWDQGVTSEGPKFGLLLVVIAIAAALWLVRPFVSIGAEVVAA